MSKFGFESTADEVLEGHDITRPGAMEPLRAGGNPVGWDRPGRLWPAEDNHAP